MKTLRQRYEQRLYERLCTILEQPHERMMYGTSYTVEPRLHPRVYGDGQLLIGICPTFTRPAYYMVRIDSGWWGDGDGDDLRDRLEEITVDIEDEFGAQEDEDEPEPWPVANFEGGYGWFRIDEIEYEEPTP